VSDPADAGSIVSTPAETGGKVVSESQYIGVKEMLRKAEEKAASLEQQLSNKGAEVLKFQTEVGSLKEQLSVAVPSDVHNKILEELNGFKTQAFEQKKTTLASTYGFKPEAFEGMDAGQLTTFEAILKSKANAAETAPASPAALIKAPPAPDLGGGGASAPNSPMEAAMAQLRKAKAEKGILV